MPELMTSVYTGMRLSEQYGLKWKDVDLQRRVIELDKIKSGSPRTVPLNSIALAGIEQQRANHPCKPSDPVFLNRAMPQTYRIWFTPSIDKAKITGYVWHGNRHAFNSRLAMAGVSMKEIQVLPDTRQFQ